MNTTDPYAGFGTITTPQNQPVPDRPEQVENNAGGFVFQIDPLSQLRRFLTIGTAGGTYYVGEKDLTTENGNMILGLTQVSDQHMAAVDALVEISLGGRAMKQNPTLFALAILCQKGQTDAKQYARKQITKVVRTGTHLFIFIGYLKQFGGINRGLRREIGKWYSEKSADKLALQLVKYRQREGFTHRDVLRLVHPKVTLPTEWAHFPKALQDPTVEIDPEQLDIYHGIVAELNLKREAIEWTLKSNGGHEKSVDEDSLPDVIKGYLEVNKAGMNSEAIARRLEMFKGLPWEALPDSAMNSTEVWDKLLDNGMPIGALLRQLPRLTQLGMVPQMGGRTDEVVQMLLNTEALQKARIHPFQVLLALKTYQQGHGFRSQWTPSAKIVDGLDEMYYRAFDFVEPTGKRTMDCLDVSASMGWASTGNLPMTPREVSAAMAMVSVRTEPNQVTMGFHHDMFDLPLSRRQRLDDVVRTISDLPFGRTDCSLPMLYAEKRALEIDTFVVYTDNETWFGSIHPFQALKRYRQVTGINSRLIVVSITPSKFSIADPSDPGMLDISGFDSAVPTLIADFSRGAI